MQVLSHELINVLESLCTNRPLQGIMRLLFSVSPTISQNRFFSSCLFSYHTHHITTPKPPSVSSVGHVSPLNCQHSLLYTGLDKTTLTEQMKDGSPLSPPPLGFVVGPTSPVLVYGSLRCLAHMLIYMVMSPYQELFFSTRAFILYKAGALFMKMLDLCIETTRRLLDRQILPFRRFIDVCDDCSE